VWTACQAGTRSWFLPDLPLQCCPDIFFLFVPDILGLFSFFNGSLFYCSCFRGCFIAVFLSAAVCFAVFRFLCFCGFCAVCLFIFFLHSVILLGVGICRFVFCCLGIGILFRFFLLGLFCLCGSGGGVCCPFSSQIAGCRACCQNSSHTKYHSFSYKCSYSSVLH